MHSWTWKTWAMLIALIAIACAAIVLVIVGVVTHTEPVWMGACWSEDGEQVSRYEVDGAADCDSVSWEERGFPLMVGVGTGNPNPPAEPVGAVRAVVDRMNARVGFALFELDAEALACRDHHAVCVMVGEPMEVGSRDASALDTAGDARHWRAPTGLYCTVRTSNTGTLEMLDLVLEHELGHCLGLAHDPFESSIMSGAPLRSTPDGAFPPRITDTDREAIRARYMR